MPETTDNLKLIIPEAPGANPNEPFDWNEFIRNNWLKVDAMKVLGDTRIINAMEYVANGLFDWAQLISDATSDGDLPKGLVIYFPPGTYPIADLYQPTQGIEFGVNESIKALWLLGAKGAIIDATGPTGDQIYTMLTIQDIEDVVVQGLTFLGKADVVANTETVAIRLRHATNAVVDSVRIENLAYGITLDSHSNDPSGKVWITRNYIKDYNKIGINLNEALNVIVKDNIITRDTAMMEPGDLSLGHGIQIKPGSTSEFHTYAVVGNQIINPRRNGIDLLNGTGAYIVEIIDNTIDKPGNFTSPGDQLVKATRGSGIRSDLSGRLIISRNIIREPLSHGIMLNGVSNLATTRIDSNSIVMGFDRGDLNGLSWHAISVEEVPNAHIANNTIRLGGWQGGFQGEVRRSIIMDDGDGAMIIGNSIEGGGGIRITDSDRVTVSNNQIDMEGWYDPCIDIYGANGATCYYPMVVGNTARTDSSSGAIRIIGGYNYARDPIVVGNTGSISASITEYGSGLDRLIGNKPDAVGFPGIIETPHFRLTNHGLIERGRYQEADFIRPSEMQPVSPAILTMDDSSHYPVISFPDGTSDSYAYVIVRLQRFDHSNDGGNIKLDILYSTTQGTTGSAYLEFGYILTAYEPVDGFPYKTTPWTTAGQYLTNTNENLKSRSVYIPKDDVDTGDTILLLRLKREPTNSNDLLAAPLYIHGIRLLWRAKHAGYEEW